MRTRWSAYAGVSVALAGGVVVKALAQRPNFYSAAVYLSQSSANLMILTNMVFVAACTFLLGLQQLLYGPLRPIEIEQLYEKAWFAVTETCLAMTIFRGEIGAWFLVMFFALLAGKVWAWIGEGRVEILEQQPPRNPRLFHTRLALSLGLSVIFNLSMLEYVVKEVMDMARPDMMVMFGFEFAVLSIVSLSTAARYGINLVEIAIIRKQKTLRAEQIRKERMEAATRDAETTQQQSSTSPTANGSAEVDDATRERNLTAAVAARNSIEAAGQQPIDEVDLEVEGWEGKGRWVFYLDLTTDFFKLVVYLSFFFILLFFYGLPIHILRDVFMTCRSFIKRIADFVRYRTATRDMNERYPDANEQEIGREDVCIICREEMRVYIPAGEGRQPNPVAERMRPKKLPCGHVLHFSCLRSWLERQQICPTCRTSVVPVTETRPGQARVPGAQGPNVQHGNAGGENAAGGRVYQFGPLRIGVGAARGNVLENLRQQLGDDQARPALAENANGAQQYGFGIRWDGMRRRERTHGNRNVQDTLNAAERQIQRELNALGGSLAELQVLRNMEAELARVRAQRQDGSQVPRIIQPATSGQFGATPTITMNPAIGVPHQALQAGSEALPPGMVLPEGWTMMPLQPVTPVLPPGMARAPGQTINGPQNVLMAMQGIGQPIALPFQHMQVPGHPQPIPGQVQVHGPMPFQQVNGVATNTNDQPENLQDVARNMADIVASRVNGIVRPTSQTTTAQQQSHQAQPLATDTTPSDNLHNSNTSNTPTPHVQQQSETEQSYQPTSQTATSLPTWGSAQPSATEISPSAAEHDRIHANGEEHKTSQENGMSSTTPVNAESSSASKKRNPTVEDLVEDPD